MHTSPFGNRLRSVPYLNEKPNKKSVISIKSQSGIRDNEVSNSGTVRGQGTSTFTAYR